MGRTEMTKKSAPPKFNPDVYSRITLNDLIVYSMHYLHSQGRAITSEDVISVCFTFFPKRFSLRKYPHWPDSAVVSRRWSDCRRKGLILGNPAKGFKLTPKGFRYAGKVEKILRGVRPGLSRIPAEVRTRAGRFVRSMETSDAFIHYKKNGRNTKISEFDFRSMLLCTMESSSATLKSNIEQFKDYAGIYHRRELITFLNFCEARFSHLLGADKRRLVKRIRKSRK